jgi:hypothetical protein
MEKASSRQQANSSHTEGIKASSQKSRLDSIYISENWLHGTISSQIRPYFVDHAILSLNVLPPTKVHHAAFWRFRNSLLNEKSLFDFIWS